MALSGSTTVNATTRSNGSTGDQLKFSWTAAQSVANNTSTVSWTLTLVSLDYGKIESTASKSWSVTVNGTSYSGTNTIGIASNATKTLASGTTTISHNSDGTKSFSYSFSQQFSITFNTWVGTVSGSGSATLDTIARASSFSVASGTLGTAQTITVTQQSSSFTHTLRYVCGSASSTIAAKSSSTSLSWTPPISLASQNTTGTSVSVTVYLQTYSGSATVGSEASKTVTMAIPSSVAPTCTVSVTDAAGYASTYGGYLVGLSKLKVTVTPTTSYSSAIKTYSISANGETGTATPYTTGTVKTAGENTVSVTVTDGRGRSGTASTTVTALAYSAPTLSISVHRCASDGTEDIGGGYIQVSYSGSITSLSGKNSASSFTLKYKKSADTDWTSVTLDTDALESSTIFEADTGSSYDVSVTLTDAVGSTITKTTSASTASAILHFGADGDRMGIGKVAETAGLDVGWDATFRGAVNFAGGIGGIPYIAELGSSTSDGTWYWVRYSNGFTELFGRRASSSVGCTASDGGSGYYGVLTNGRTFPITFTSVLTRHYYCQAASNGAISISASSDGTTSSTGKLLVRTPTSCTLTSVTLFMHITGVIS